MFRKRCRLCGGKLVDNKCTLCGLDNSKSDADYTVNVNHCDGKPLTHVHMEEKKEQPKEKENVAQEQPKESVAQEQPKESVAQEQYKELDEETSEVQTEDLEDSVELPEIEPVFQAEKENKNSKKGWIATLAAIILVLGLEGIGEIADVASEWFQGNAEKEMQETIEVVDYDDSQYEYATWELSDIGDIFEEDLQRGEYIVGVHIPEGTYKVNNLGGYTYLALDDFENLIYIGEEFRGTGKEVEDLRCYTGAKLKVDGENMLHFYSENAQCERMVSLENPLKESVEVKNEFVAGVHFPAGTYDIVEAQSLNTGVKFSYIVPETIAEDSEEEDSQVTGLIWIDASMQEFVYKNLYLPEGTRVFVEGGDSVHLEPSDGLPESYEGYYYMHE